MWTARPLRLDVDGVEAVSRLDVDSRIAIGYVAAQLACIVEANHPDLDRNRIENLSIDFAYRLHLAKAEH
jgi:hypothetical protein